MKRTVFILLFFAVLQFSFGAHQQRPLNDTITVQPQDAYACQDAGEVLFIVASSIPNVSFEWQYYNPANMVWVTIPSDNGDFNGQDRDSLIITNINAYNQYSFRCKLHVLFNMNDEIISDAAILHIMLPPVADFSWVYPCQDTTVHFNDLSTDPNGSMITSWFWDFGDGDTSYMRNPDHIYSSADEYEVKLTVLNEFGCQDEMTQNVEIIPFINIQLYGPEVVCSNQTSNYYERYYTFENIKDNCIYLWILPQPELYIQDTLLINDQTLRIDWKAVDESTQVTLQVEEWLQLGDGLECLTGKGSMDILIVKQKAANEGKIIPKAEDKAILLYLGEPASSYQWGYTINAFDEDPANDDTIQNTEFHSNYCDFGELDPNKLYWVEILPESWMDCWTRTYYLLDDKSLSIPTKRSNTPVETGSNGNEQFLVNPNK